MQSATATRSVDESNLSKWPLMLANATLPPAGQISCRYICLFWRHTQLSHFRPAIANSLKPSWAADPPIAAHVVPFSQSEVAQLPLDQSERSWQPFCPEAAGEQRSWWDREREGEVGEVERGGPREDAADHRAGARLPGRPLPRRHRRDRTPNAQGEEQPRQQ